MLVYRLTPTRYAADTSGIGAKLKGGRWNPPGYAIHYTSTSAALSVLEFLVHVDVSELPPMSLITYEIPDDLICTYSETLPDRWQESPPPIELSEIGRQWLTSQSSLALIVPAVLFPAGHESNVLVNPSHPDFSKVKTVGISPFEFDQRLLP